MLAFIATEKLKPKSHTLCHPTPVTITTGLQSIFIEAIFACGLSSIILPVPCQFRKEVLPVQTGRLLCRDLSGNIVQMH